MVKYPDRSHVNGSSALPKGSFLYGRWSQLCEAAFTPRGDSANCNSRVLLLLRVPRHWSGVHYHHRSYGRFRWPFQQATFFGGEKKNIRFTPTKNSNMIFMAHSCGLGGKYQYKHAKVFQIGHLKKASTVLFRLFFPFGWQHQTCLWHSEAKVISIQDIFLISLICILVSVQTTMPL